MILEHWGNTRVNLQVKEDGNVISETRIDLINVIIECLLNYEFVFDISSRPELCEELFKERDTFSSHLKESIFRFISDTIREK